MSQNPARTANETLDTLIGLVTRINLNALEDTLYYCSHEWPVKAPCLARMVSIRDKLQQAASEVAICL